MARSAGRVRKEITEGDHKLCVTRQADVLGISRGCRSREPRPTREDDLGLMRRIDEWHMKRPIAGRRRMKGLLRQQGVTGG